MVAGLVDIDVYHARNGVVLCKHLERLLQAGHWSLVPISCAPNGLLSCRIHVAETELETELQDIGSTDSDRAFASTIRRRHIYTLEDEASSRPAGDHSEAVHQVAAAKELDGFYEEPGTTKSAACQQVTRLHLLVRLA